MNASRLEVRIFLTVGLLIIVLLHAITLTTAQRVAPHIERALFEDASTAAPVSPLGGINFDDGRNSDGIVNTLPVNNAARDEIKRQRQQPYCPPCDVNPPQVQPVRPSPAAVPAAPANAPNMIAKPTTPRYSIELFVLHNDPLSATVLDWFNTNAMLQKWSKSTNHNTYTRDSAIYKTRFANSIPVGSFPVVLVTAPDGGHVYVADRTTMPAGASALVTAISDATKNQKEAKQKARESPAIDNTDGRRSLIEAIAADCKDGNCEPEREPFWRRLQGQQEVDPVQGLLRSILRPGETLLTMVLIAVVVVAVVYFVKRGQA
jgi:hypothetical protein